MMTMEAAAAQNDKSCAETESQHENQEEYLSKDLYFRVKQLEKEKAELQQRLDFVEALVGPTEAQRKLMQEKLLAARTAALQAKWRGACLPTKVAGRVDEMLLFSRGLSDTDAGLLQGGCLPNSEGILQDVSMLGDPGFHPYSSQTGEPKWQARGGLLRLSLEEIGHRFGEEIAQDVVRCAKELDKYDASRRVGVELPWHPMEDRELEPAEVINLMDRELALAANLSYRYPDEPLEQLTDLAFGDGPGASPGLSPDGHDAPLHGRRGCPASRAKRSRGRHAQSRRSAGSAAAVYAPGDRSVGNKRDLKEERQVSFLEASRFAQEKDILFLETSALTGENVQDVFHTLAQRILNKVEEGICDIPESRTGGQSSSDFNRMPDRSDRPRGAGFCRCGVPRCMAG